MWCEVRSIRIEAEARPGRSLSLLLQTLVHTQLFSYFISTRPSDVVGKGAYEGQAGSEVCVRLSGLTTSR